MQSAASPGAASRQRRCQPPHQYQQQLGCACRTRSRRAAAAAARAAGGGQPALVEVIGSACVVQFPDSDGLPAEIRGARALLLDQSGNIHSVWRPHRQAGEAPLTGVYFDALALLPACVPPGPLVILGLGAGSVAHLLAHFWPARPLHGWELEPAVLQLAQAHMGLQPLLDAGHLAAHLGDALADSAAVPGGAAGVVVDLFAEGCLIPQLLEAPAWLSIRRRLAPGGRAMANLGAAPLQGDLQDASSWVGADLQATWAALQAVSEAFDGELLVRSLVSGATVNLLVLTGPPVPADVWAQLPAELRQFARFGGSSWQPWRAPS